MIAAVQTVGMPVDPDALQPFIQIHTWDPQRLCRPEKGLHPLPVVVSRRRRAVQNKLRAVLVAKIPDLRERLPVRVRNRRSLHPAAHIIPFGIRIDARPDPEPLISAAASFAPCILVPEAVVADNRENAPQRFTELILQLLRAMIGDKQTVRLHQHDGRLLVLENGLQHRAGGLRPLPRLSAVKGSQAVIPPDLHRGKGGVAQTVADIDDLNRLRLLILNLEIDCVPAAGLAAGEISAAHHDEGHPLHQDT